MSKLTKRFDKLWERAREAEANDLLERVNLHVSARDVMFMLEVIDLLECCHNKANHTDTEKIFYQRELQSLEQYYGSQSRK